MDLNESYEISDKDDEQSRNQTISDLLVNCKPVSIHRTSDELAAYPSP